jgi:hypothetical protein
MTGDSQLTRIRANTPNNLAQMEKFDMPYAAYDRAQHARDIFREIADVNYRLGKWEVLGTKRRPQRVRMIRRPKRWTAMLWAPLDLVLEPLVPLPRDVRDYFVVDRRDAYRLPWGCELWASAGGKVASLRYSENKLSIVSLNYRKYAQLFGLDCTVPEKAWPRGARDPRSVGTCHPPG